MRGVFFAESAIFVKLQSVGGVLFVFVTVVVTLFTLRASQSYLNSVALGISHRTIS